MDDDRSAPPMMLVFARIQGVRSSGLAALHATGPSMSSYFLPWAASSAVATSVQATVHATAAAVHRDAEHEPAF